jgi:phage tail sheath gpL-like
LTGLLAPRAGKKFIWTERNSLLGFGIATSMVVSGVLQVERAVTTYQKNSFAQADPSYFDSETLHTSAYVIRYLRSAITQKYPRHKLANDGTRFGAGNAVVTPAVLRGELLAAYDQLEFLGIVENKDAFNAALIVERDTINPNRVNILFPPDYQNQLRVLGVLMQFRLNYPVAA